MATFIMNWHLLGLVVIQFFPNAGFVFRCQSGPGFVCPPVILVCGGHLYVVIELDYLKLSRHKFPSFSSPIDILLTFLFLSSSTVGLKLSLRSRYLFFSSLSLRMESLSSSKKKEISYLIILRLLILLLRMFRCSSSS